MSPSFPSRRYSDLLGLGEKRDLADAAAPELYVMAVDGDHRAALVRVDLPLDGVHVLDGPEVEVLAPDAGPPLAQEGLAERAVAGHRARLAHGAALPVLAQAFAVGEGGVQDDSKRHGAGIGPAAQVGAEAVDAGRPGAQAALEAAG